MSKETIKKRIEQSKKKGLIIENDYTIYNDILNKYKEGFEGLLNQKLKLNNIDIELYNSNLYFSPSTSVKNKFSTHLKSDYIYYINDFYIENMSIEDIERFKKVTAISEKTFEIVKRTYKDVLLKKNVDTVMYNPPSLLNKVRNGTLVLMLVYGKNKRKLSEEEYLENRLKQKIFLENISLKLEKKVNEALEIPCRVIIEKRA